MFVCSCWGFSNKNQRSTKNTSVTLTSHRNTLKPDGICQKIAQGAQRYSREPPKTLRVSLRTPKVVPKYAQGTPRDSQGSPKGSQRGPHIYPGYPHTTKSPLLDTPVFQIGGIALFPYGYCGQCSIMVTRSLLMWLVRTSLGMEFHIKA